MHGDFSRWILSNVDSNDQGLLHQQGKVLLDQDVNAMTVLGIRWQMEVSRAAFGGGLVAVPEGESQSFQVTGVRTDASGTWITVAPGLVFCDGVLVYLDEHDPIEWLADPDSPPPVEGERHAIMLLCWHETVSGFQDERLLEPALGGPDTAVRARLAMALRLVRLEPGQHCRDAQLDNDSGRLTVTLDPPADLGDPDCPIEDAGGYRGINHHLYRIEIAATNDNVGRFKWSRFNGGLVGRGRFTDAGGTPRLEVRANQRAIATSGLTSVYVEALAYDSALRRWRVVYGARGTLANDHQIDLAPDIIVGPGLPGPPTTDYFIRIWDGIELIGTGTHPLGDGINATFTGGGDYLPETYWTFPVRAGLPNEPTLLDDARAEGPGWLRAPLAVFTWGAAGTVDPATIEDCRRPFSSLARLRGCCTIRVGDGTNSHGDVTSLQAAIERLPPEGGTICLLPGVHEGGAHLRERHDVTIQGCGAFSVIRGPAPPSGDEPAPAALRISGGGNIRIEHLAVAADDRGPGILVDRDGGSMCRGIAIERVLATGAGPSAIDIDDAEDVLIRDCDVAMADRVVSLPSGRWPAITLYAIDARVERNRIRVAVDLPAQQFEGPNSLVSPTTADPVTFNNLAFTIRRERSLVASAGLGGLWLRGGCEHVTVVDNRIESGIGHGIILGHVIPSQPEPGTPSRLGWIHNFNDPCAPCADGTVIIWPGIPGSSGGNNQALPGPPLSTIAIERNEILTMGMAGISVYGFFEDQGMSPIAVHGLRIAGNQIRECWRRGRAPISSFAITLAGYGTIALARVDDLELRDNLLEGNGVAHEDPLCALYIWMAERANLAGNTMERNGVPTATATAAQGPRAGVYLQNVLGSLTVHHNQIDAATGPALRASGFGPVTVSGNRMSASAANDLREVIYLAIDRAGLEDVAGPIAFTDNQVRFDGRGVPPGTHALKITVTAGDLAFADNQCFLIATEETYEGHVVLNADSVRLNSCRLWESTESTKFSAIVGPTRLAIVTLNQSEHCLAVSATVRIQRDNIENGVVDSNECLQAADAYFGLI